MKNFLKELVEVIDTALMLIGVFGFYAILIILLYRIWPF